MGGYGIPVIYVFGGRDANGEPLDVVQKYYPETYGTEDYVQVPAAPQIYFDINTGLPVGQLTNTQTDIWSDMYRFHDYDWLPQAGESVNPPIVPDRMPGADTAVRLNPLPEALYGHVALEVTSAGNIEPPPVWPEGPYYYIFILGGINDTGIPVASMRWFNYAAAPPEREGEGEPEQGDYSLVSEMPIERAFHDAIVILPNKLTNRPWRIVVFGGFDRNGNYISQIDQYTFDSITNPVEGTWETIADAPQAAAGLGAGWQEDDRGFVYKQMGGRTIDGYTGSVYDVLASDSSVSVAPTGLLPRGWVGMGGAVAPNEYFTGEGFYVIGAGSTSEGMLAGVIEVYRP